MRALSVFIALFLGMMSAAPGIPKAGPVQNEQAGGPPSTPELVSFIDGVVEAAMQSLKIAGVELAIVQGGHDVLLKGYGLSCIDPLRGVDPERTMFRIGSISKTFTWILLMREIEKGRVRLDAPVNDYLPDRLKIPDRGFKSPVRVIHLLSHSAGFAAGTPGEFVKDPAKLLSLEDRLRLQFPERVREPGLVSSYSDQGAELAGLIAARLNGLDFETLAERDIFEPLGMKYTTFRQPYPPRPDLPSPMPNAMADDLSTGFGGGGPDFIPRPFEFTPGPSGSVSSTAGDIARFMRALLGGGRLGGTILYGPDTARAFRTPIMSMPEGANGWAHGFIVYSLPGGLKGYGHSGGMLSFLSNMIVVPDLDLGIYISTNTNTGWGLAERLAEAIIERFFAPQALFRPAGDPGLLSQADLYEGRYLATRRAYSGLAKFKYLIRSTSTVTITPDGYLFAIGQKWAPTKEPGRFRAIDRDRYLNFQLDPSGRATSFLDESGTSAWERAGWIWDRGLFLVLGGLTIAVALILIAGSLARLGCGRPVPSRQRMARILVLSASLLWIAWLFALTRWLGEGTLERVYGWPGTNLLSESTAALLATALSTTAAVLLPFVWAERTGWGVWRKGFHSLAIIVFLSFGTILAVWGGLIPWNL